MVRVHYEQFPRCELARTATTLSVAHLCIVDEKPDARESF